MDTGFVFHPLLNRSPSLATISAYADRGLRLRGCGLNFKVTGPKRAHYQIMLSLITPHLRLAGGGKAPFLGAFKAAIADAIKGAANTAYRNLVRPPASMSVAVAAQPVMREAYLEAYLKASDNGALPAKARQIMYAARGRILELTGTTKFSDKYFTQTLLPDYLGFSGRNRRLGCGL